MFRLEAREAGALGIDLPDQKLGKVAAARYRVPDDAEDCLVFVLPVEPIPPRAALFDRLNLANRKPAANHRGKLHRRHQGGDRKEEILFAHLTDVVGDGVPHVQQNRCAREVTGSSTVG